MALVPGGASVVEFGLEAIGWDVADAVGIAGRLGEAVVGLPGVVLGDVAAEADLESGGAGAAFGGEGADLSEVGIGAQERGGEGVIGV
ncbi:MAG: hypothetical protein NVS9B15_14920 [Acidobacteriaceae bacterium]